MMRALPKLLLSAVALLPAALAQNDPSPAKRTPQQAPKARPVGVIDFARVLEAYPRAIELKKQIDGLRTQRQAQLDQEQTRADEIRMSRDNFKQGTKEWAVKDLELQLALRALDGTRQIFELELRNEREKFYAMMLGDMERATAMVAKEQGVSLVLRIQGALPDGSNETKARVLEPL